MEACSLFPSVGLSGNIFGGQRTGLLSVVPYMYLNFAASQQQKRFKKKSGLKDTYLVVG
jgi:hypothetical protein